MPTIVLLNQKGGVGKTSTCHHVAGALAVAGRKVLLVDVDPQASLTQGFWGPAATRQLPLAATIAAVLAGDEPFPDQIIKPTGITGIDLVPGSRHAVEYNVPAPHRVDPAVQGALHDFLAEVGGRYDQVIIDCPPNLHLCSWAALVAADYLIVPLQPEDYGAQGIIDVQESIERVRGGPNPSVRTLGLLPTMVNSRLSVHRTYEAMLREIYGMLVFETVVPLSTDFKEALGSRQPVALYKPRGAAAKAIKALVEEIDQRVADSARISRGAA